MAIETHMIKVTAETTVPDMLDAANKGPVQIERDSVLYVLQRVIEDDAIWENYDTEAVVAMLEDLKHNPIDIKIQQWIADVYRWREEGTRPEDRP